MSDKESNGWPECKRDVYHQLQDLKDDIVTLKRWFREMEKNVANMSTGLTLVKWKVGAMMAASSAGASAAVIAAQNIMQSTTGTSG